MDVILETIEVFKGAADEKKLSVENFDGSLRIDVELFSTSSVDFDNSVLTRLEEMGCSDICPFLVEYSIAEFMDSNEYADSGVDVPTSTWPNTDAGSRVGDVNGIFIETAVTCVSSKIGTGVGSGTVDTFTCAVSSNGNGVVTVLEVEIDEVYGEILALEYVGEVIEKLIINSPTYSNTDITNILISCCL